MACGGFTWNDGAILNRFVDDNDDDICFLNE